MTWLTWRLHRTAGVLVVLVAILCAGLLTHFATDLQSIYAAAGIDCSIAVGGLPVMCSEDVRNIRTTYVNDAGIGPINVAGVFQPLLYVLPGLLGVFVGAPLLAREFEEKSHWVAWTQGISRARWLGTKVGLVMLTVALAMMGLGIVALVEAAYFPQPWLAFDVAPPVFVAHSIFAIALGVATGTLVRNTPSAMAGTFISFAVAYVFVIGRRWSIVEPARIEGDSIPLGGFQLDTQYYDASGHEITDIPAAVYQRLNNPGSWTSALRAEGITEINLYQPFERFWLFQAMETAIFLALAAILIALTFLIVHRRDA
jgi:ABC-type transport system involved in multi-copper enzyme maturation permease subunit